MHKHVSDKNTHIQNIPGIYGQIHTAQVVRAGRYTPYVCIAHFSRQVPTYYTTHVHIHIEHTTFAQIEIAHLETTKWLHVGTRCT